MTHSLRHGHAAGTDVIRQHAHTSSAEQEMPLIFLRRLDFISHAACKPWKREAGCRFDRFIFFLEADLFDAATTPPLLHSAIIYLRLGLPCHFARHA